MVKKSNNIWNSYTQKKTNVATRECWHCTAKNIPYGDWSTLQISMEHQQMIVSREKSIMMISQSFNKKTIEFRTLLISNPFPDQAKNIFPDWYARNQRKLPEILLMIWIKELLDWSKNKTSLFFQQL